MWMVTATDSRGDYPIAFFDDEGEANYFAGANSKTWQGIHVEKVHSAKLRSILVDASHWTITKP